MRIEKKDKGHWQAVLSTESGIEVLRQILGVAGVFKQCGSNKSEEQFFSEGRRSIGLEIIDAVAEADPRTLSNLLVRSARKEKPRKKGQVNDADPNETTDPEE